MVVGKRLRVFTKHLLVGRCRRTGAQLRAGLMGDELAKWGCRSQRADRYGNVRSPTDGSLATLTIETPVIVFLLGLQSIWSDHCSSHESSGQELGTIY